MRKSGVIYSALVGAYDTVPQPLVVDERFDYILFTDNTEPCEYGVWQARKIPYHNQDSTRICRYVKTHPEELLSDYDFSIWVDASIQINTCFIYERSLSLFYDEVLFASMWHPVRDCIYDEAFAVVNMMVEHEGVVLDWCHRIKKEHFPRHLGLFETGVVYRKHCSEIKALDSLWWSCIAGYSRRDQLSCNYSLWKMNIPTVYFADAGNNTRNMPDFSLRIHKDIRHNHCEFKKNEAWLMRYCWKNKSQTSRISELYYRLYSSPCPRLSAFLLGQIFRIKHLVSHAK